MGTAGDSRERAESLALHQPGRPLVLVNAWDVATARIFEEAGSAAIGTTSAGIAFASGYPDGESIPRERMLEAVARICAAELARIGVARISLGSGPMRAVMTAMRRLAEEALTSGTYSMLEGITTHAEMNRRMTARSAPWKP